MYSFSLITILLILNNAFAFPGFTHPIFASVSQLNLAYNGLRSAPTSELWFTQKVDHFGSDKANSTFQQRYFVNDRYYKPGGPALLFIGGEHETTSIFTEIILLTQAAQQLNGVVYALEHRYYGESQPTEDWSYQNLKYLTTQQAIADIANFIEEVQLPGQTFNTKPKTKWIVAGFSYSANLAAWSRSKLPHLITGAIASSAPVLAKADFFEYELITQKSVLQNGGQACIDYYVEVFEHIDRILNSKDRAQIDILKSKFNVTSDVLDIGFALTINNFVPSYVQYNNLNAPTNVKTHCNSLKLNSTIEEKINEFGTNYSNINCPACISFADIPRFQNVTINPTDIARPFLYQCCNEFGYWQLAPSYPALSIRSRLPTVKAIHEEYCSKIFKQGLVPNTEYINNYYGGKNLRVSNILFNNGELDPWSELSILPNYPNHLSSMPAFLIEGASHISDIFLPDTESDSKPVLEAKARTLEFIAKWIKD